MAWPFIYDRAYPEKHWTASLGNPVGVMEASSILLFVEQVEKSKEELILKKPMFWQLSAKNLEKNSLPVESCFKTHCCTYCLLCFSFHVTCINTLDTANCSLKSHFPEQKFSVKILWRIRKLSAKDWMQVSVQLPPPNQLWDAMFRILGQQIAKK